MKKDEKKMKNILQRIKRLPLSPYRQRDKPTNKQNETMKTNLYFCQKGRFAGYWRRIPFNYDYLKLAKRGHYTIQTID